MEKKRVHYVIWKKRKINYNKTLKNNSAMVSVIIFESITLFEDRASYIILGNDGIVAEDINDGDYSNEQNHRIPRSNNSLSSFSKNPAINTSTAALLP